MTRAFLLVAVLLVAACSSRQLYDAGSGWRHGECNRAIESAERARCMDTASKDHDSYRREAGQR
jgi:hypothetical protein